MLGGVRKVILTTIVFLAGCQASSVDMFPAWGDLDDFERDWFSAHISAAKEQPLTPIRPTETHRFTWLRSFHQPVVVRVHCDDSCDVTTKVLSGLGGYGPGKIVSNSQRTLNSVEKTKLQDVLLAASLWDGQPATDTLGMDGAQWIFESRVGERYIAWNVWSPAYETQFQTFQELCLYFLDLSELEIPQDEMY